MVSLWEKCEMIVDIHGEKYYSTDSIKELVDAIFYEKYYDEPEVDPDEDWPSYLLNNIQIRNMNIAYNKYTGSKEEEIVVNYTIELGGLSIPIYISDSRNKNDDFKLSPWETHMKENIEVCIEYGIEKMAKK
jgi:hypothetical protein